MSFENEKLKWERRLFAACYKIREIKNQHLDHSLIDGFYVFLFNLFYL